MGEKRPALRLNKKMILQFMLVFAAFFIMVSIGSLFGSHIVSGNLESYGEEAVKSVYETMKAYFDSPKITLENIAFSVEFLKKEGVGTEVMSRELESWGDWILADDERISSFSVVYGVLDGEFVSSIPWGDDPTYIPEERSWYLEAVKAQGEIFFCDPYVDYRTKETVLTMSKLLFDKNGDPFGVIAIDIFMTGHIEYINSLRLLDSGYGILLDTHRRVIAHYDDDLLGKAVGEINNGEGGYGEMDALLMEEGDIRAFDFVSYEGNKSVSFYRKLPNGWYVGIVAPRSAYYNDVNIMVWVLISAGFVLMLLLCALLAFLHWEKTRSDEANQMKSSFLARMSHEIRTPMNAVIGMTELILRKELPQDIYENALGIKSASLNLMSIINDILDFSKIETGMMEITESEYLLPSLINDVIGVIRIRLIDKPVQFAVNIDPRIPVSLWGDEIRLRQMLINLLSNAVKYTDEGGISLTVTGEVADHRVMLTMAVADSGVGIRAEDMERLFGDFVQIDTEKNRGIEGTGLGLAITRSLCRLMGGEITVKSEYGKGSTFTAVLPQSFDVYAPFAVVDNPETKSILLYETRKVYRDSLVASFESLGVPYACADTIPAFFAKMEGYSHAFVSSFLYGSVSPVLSKMKNPPALVLLADITEALAPRDVSIMSLPATSLSIANMLGDVYEYHDGTDVAGASFAAPDANVLIVDDVTANLKVGEGLMLPYNMNITLCSGGRKAVELVRENHYDLVFMDHMMPDIDGVEATHLIRSMEGDYFKALPIVALTANAVSGMREMFIQNGMNDFLSKPIETTKMNAILEKWIPKEKQKAVQAIKQKEAKNEFVEALRNLPDFSVDKALMVAGGSAETYERTVKLSVRLLPENINRLNALIHGDLPNYRILVHGVKGVLNNMGAYAMAGLAKELEDLSGRGDHESCLAFHPDFAQRLANLTNIVLGLMESTAVRDSDKEKGGIDLLTDALPGLKEAVDTCEMTIGTEVLTSLRQYSFGAGIDRVLKEMAFAFDNFDFGAAGEKLRELEDKMQEAGGR